MHQEKNVWAGIALALATLPAIAGCQSQVSSSPEVAGTRLSRVVDRGEGVYQFPVADWPQSLVDFRKEHPELKVTAMFAGEQFGGGTGMSNESVVVITEPQ